MADEEASVQVAVRMRIFNQREKDANSELVIRMRREDMGSRTWVRNPETNEEKEFKYDYSFNSHSADKTDVLGPYATQDFVFQDLGMPVLNAALEGRDVTLFAYGQTGAGKSFSMLGKTDVDHLQGIIPRTCKQIFKVIAENISNPLVLQEVSIQVVEVYCEQINDLLADRKTWPPTGHKPKLQKGGGYGVDTNKKFCVGYDDIESAFKFADKNRSVGSHALNPESSRAHTIYQICYKKTTKLSADATQAETVPANLNLVDLAGSERTESAGTSGQMLKEGNAINLSLTALGGCIKALSENAKQVNFRDSKLTLLLQRSMTSGRVIMIAAISPASICYEETVSTLRFAERIKMVKIKSRKNVTLDPVAEIKKEMEEMKKAMQTEIDNLRLALDKQGIDPDKVGTISLGGGGGGADPEEVQELKRLLAEQKENEEALRKEIEKEIKASLMSDADRKASAQASAQALNKQWTSALGGATMENKEDIKEPHLLNLNPEERLAETLIYKLKAGTTVAGRANKDSPPDLEFSGMGMVKEHCVFTWDEAKKKVTLAPRTAGARCLVNGAQLEGPMDLKHNDRVWLGNNYAFRFAFPGLEIAARPLPDGARADYYLAESEIAENQAKETEGGSEVTALNSKLAEALKKVQQANIVADDLSTGATFQPKIVANRETGENQIVVNVQLPNGNLTWPWAKFDVRLIEMVKMWEHWQHASDNGTVYEAPKENNPFVDREHQLIGEADVWLQSLGNMIEVDLEPPVLSVTGNKEGQLQVTLLPLDKKGGEGPWDDDRADLDPFVDEPKELLNKEVQVAVNVKNARFDADLSMGGRAKYYDTWVRYRFHDTDAWTETPHDAAKTLTPNYNCKSKFKFIVDEAMLKQITKGKVTLQVWGKMTDEKPTGAAAQQVPPGWTRVQAWMDPEGKLHKELPKA